MWCGVAQRKLRSAAGDCSPGGERKARGEYEAIVLWAGQGELGRMVNGVWGVSVRFSFLLRMIPGNGRHWHRSLWSVLGYGFV